MSLNKFKDYTKYTIIDGELKAKKLGLKDAPDNKCCFISNTGDKEIIARDITPADLPGSGFTNGSYTLYTMISPFVQSITENVNADYFILQQNTGSYQGSFIFDLQTMKTGDKLELEYYGHYTNSLGVTSDDGFRYTRLYFGNQFITWDAVLDDTSFTLFPAASGSQATATRHFKFNFQIIARSDWDPVNKAIDMTASGNFLSNNTATNNSNATQTAVYSIKNFTLTEQNMSRPDPQIIKVLATSTLFPVTAGFVLYYEGMNYKICKGLYPVIPVNPP